MISLTVRSVCFINLSIFSDISIAIAIGININNVKNKVIKYFLNM